MPVSTRATPRGSDAEAPPAAVAEPQQRAEASPQRVRGVSVPELATPVRQALQQVYDASRGSTLQLYESSKQTFEAILSQIADLQSKVAMLKQGQQQRDSSLNTVRADLHAQMDDLRLKQYEAEGSLDALGAVIENDQIQAPNSGSQGCTPSAAQQPQRVVTMDTSQSVQGATSAAYGGPAQGRHMQVRMDFLPAERRLRLNGNAHENAEEARDWVADYEEGLAAMGLDRMDPRAYTFTRFNCKLGTPAEAWVKSYLQQHPKGVSPLGTWPMMSNALVGEFNSSQGVSVARAQLEKLVIKTKNASEFAVSSRELRRVYALAHPERTPEQLNNDSDLNRMLFRRVAASFQPLGQDVARALALKYMGTPGTSGYNPTSHVDELLRRVTWAELVEITLFHIQTREAVSTTRDIVPAAAKTNDLVDAAKQQLKKDQKQTVRARQVDVTEEADTHTANRIAFQRPQGRGRGRGRDGGRGGRGGGRSGGGGRGSGRGRGPNAAGGYTCWTCGQAGHLARDCKQGGTQATKAPGNR